MPTPRRLSLSLCLALSVLAGCGGGSEGERVAPALDTAAACDIGPAVPVTGAVQAESGHCYVARSDAAAVVVTLPASPAVGDRLRITGAGAAGWQIAQNPGQAVETPTLGGEAGWLWTAHTPNQSSSTSANWIKGAWSGDGRTLVGISAPRDALYLSKDAGATWTQTGPALSWNSVAISADGTKLAATAYWGQIHTSTDGGQTWTARETSRPWYAVASSADGMKLVAVVYGGQIHTSTDGGVTWTARASTQFWQPALASSSDGTRLAAAVAGGQIHVSSDSGVTWTPTDTNRNWISLASSADGMRLVAADYGGQLHVSDDAGQTWTARGPSRNWYGVASSADGQRLIAAERNGYLHVSTDGGVTWTALASQRDWFGVASSADGRRLMATDFTTGGSLYTSVASTRPGTDGSISGGATDTIDLRYLGDGLFEVTGFQGKPMVR